MKIKLSRNNGVYQVSVSNQATDNRRSGEFRKIEDAFQAISDWRGWLQRL